MGAGRYPNRFTNVVVLELANERSAGWTEDNIIPIIFIRESFVTSERWY